VLIKLRHIACCRSSLRQKVGELLRPKLPPFSAALPNAKHRCKKGILTLAPNEENVMHGSTSETSRPLHLPQLTQSENNDFKRRVSTKFVLPAAHKS